MNIKVGEHVVQVQINEQSEVTSKHTGVELKCLKVGFQVRGKLVNEEVLGLIERGKQEGLTSVDESGNFDKKWKVGNSSWSYTEGTHFYHHTMELQEMEDIKIDIL